MFNAFFKVIRKFHSFKANVEFTIVCFDGIDIIAELRAQSTIVKKIW